MRRPPSPIVIAGFSEACGSWKTICSVPAHAGAARARAARRGPRPSKHDAAGGRPDQAEQRPAERRLARCRTRRPARGPRPARRSKSTPSTALHRAGRRGRAAGANVAAQREVDLRGRGPRPASSSADRRRLRLRPQRPSPRARAARRRPRGISSSGRAASTRRAGRAGRRSVGGHCCGADLHRVRAARVEPAAGRRVDQVRRRARDGVQLGRRQRDRRAQQLPRVRVRRARRRPRAPAPCSTIRPAYITATRSQASATMPRLWVISSSAVSKLRRRSARMPQDLRLDEHVERGRRLVGDDERRAAARAPARS